MAVKLTQVKRTYLGGFANPWPTWIDTRWRVVFSFPFYSGDPDCSPAPTDPLLDQQLPIHSPKFGDDKEDGIRLTWLGHASVLFHIDGVRVIFDPIFSDRCFIGPMRYRPPACKVSFLVTFRLYKSAT